MSVTGKQIQDALEFAARFAGTEKENGGFLQDVYKRQPPFFPAASGTILPASGRRISPAGWNILQVRKSWSFRRTVRN